MSALGHNESSSDKTSKLREDLSTVLPNLPDHLLKPLVEELQNDLQVYVLDDDLRETDESQLAEIKSLKGAQKNIFLKYAESLRSLKEVKQDQTTSVTAIGFENTTDKPLDVNLSGNASIKVAARNPGKGQPGTYTAKGFVGHGNFKADGADSNVKYTVTAGDDQIDYKKMDFIKLLRDAIPSVPDKKIEELVEELGNDFGVYGESDLRKANPEGLKSLKSLVGVALDSFLEYITSFKQGSAPEMDTSPTPGMYNQR